MDMPAAGAVPCIVENSYLFMEDEMYTDAFQGRSSCL